MFSRIYKSARALLTDVPQTPAKKITIHTSTSAMVTSRSQSRAARGENDVDGVVNDDNTIQVSVSAGKKRRLRSSIGEDNGEGEKEVRTPTPKKRKTLPVREKDSSPLVKKTIPVVEIPARQQTPVLEAKAGSPVKPIEIEEDVEESSDEEVGEEEGENVVAPQGVDVDTKTKHKRFDSEEAEPEVFSTAPEVSESVGEVADSEDDSDSEDDAPETIGVQEAAKEIKLKERDTAKAVKEQETASRKKRKERDEVLKKQSEKAKKRKPATVAPESEASSDEEAQPRSALELPETAEFRSQILSSRSALPDFLPAEYLEDTDPQELIRAEDAEAPRKKAKKTKFIDAALKAPKDWRVGKTTYRVSKAGSANLAPKSSFVARSMKEAWMQGRSGGKVDPNRRAFGKAFGRR